MMDAITLAKSFKRLMARSIMTEEETFQLLFANENPEAPGAVIKALHDLHVFIDGYSKEIDLENINGSRLDKVASWVGLARLVAEPDSAIRTRFESIFLRGGVSPWGTIQSIRATMRNIYPEGESFILPSWPRIDMVQDGEFDSMAGWSSSGSATYQQIIEDRMNGACVVVDTTSGSKQFFQEIQCPAGRYSALCIFSRTPSLQGAISLKVKAGQVVLADTIAYTEGNRPNGAGIADISFIIESPMTVVLEVGSVPGYSCVIDAVRMGIIDYPSILACVFNEFGTFHDGTIPYNGRIVSNGYQEPWKNVWLDDLVNSIRPAGVFVEIMTRPFIQLS